MVNFQDPGVVMEDISMVAKLWAFVDGVYIWEYITNLDYEWSYIRGHRTYNWTIWIYSTTRLATLITAMLDLVAIGVNRRIYNCQLVVTFQLIFGYLAVNCASLLVVLRIIAIWNKKRTVVAITASTWVVSVVFTIQSVARIRAGFSNGAICEMLNLSVAKPNTLVRLATTIILLVIMFIGLLSNHLYESGTYSLGRLLWKQGLVWLLIATIAELLPAVFICLGLNNPLEYIFELPSVIAISIAATRIHRSLTQFAASTNFNLPRVLENSRSPVSSADRALPTVTPIGVPLNHMEVAVHGGVHKTYGRFDVSHHQVSFVVAGGESLGVAGPVPKVEEETMAISDTGPVTDSEVKSNAETSNTGTVLQLEYSATDTTNV